MFYDAIVPQRTVEEIDRKAEETGVLLEMQDEVPRNLLALVRDGFGLLDINFRYEICANDQMPDRDGQTIWNPVGIRVPQRIHDQLEYHGHRARFTVAHELGHIMLHPGEEFSRHAAEKIRRSNYPAGRSAEWQANVFAAAFLMPRAICVRATSPVELSKLATTSVDAAERRMRDLRMWPKTREISPRIQKLLDEIRAATKRFD